MTRKIGRLLWSMGSGIWLGTIIFFSLVVAEAVFRVLPLEDAGKLLVQIFPAYYDIGLWAGGAAMVGALIVAWFSPRKIGWVLFAEAHVIEVERNALREALTTLLREHDCAPDAKGSDAWDAARKLLEGK